MAVAAAFLSLLIGKRLPEDMALFTSMDMFGAFSSKRLDKAGLQATRADGIATLVCTA